jgi:hypothetical protein
LGCDVETIKQRPSLDPAEACSADPNCNSHSHNGKEDLAVISDQGVFAGGD